MLKKTILQLSLVSALVLSTQTYAKTNPVTTLNASQQVQQAEKNKKIVLDFYQGVFQKHQVKSYADRYIGNQYRQHNPYVADGKAPFVDYFVQYFKENPQASSQIKRVIADGDLVWLHVHSQANPQDRGSAVIDIFRVKDGKIVEHWDVIQEIPETSANNNTMF
jgi:predicted SnoaL-like aldol condensation-catalyzing enzyme